MIAQLFSLRFGLLIAVLALAGWWLAPPGPEQTGPVVRAKRDDWSTAELLRRPNLSGAAVEVAGAGMWGAQTSAPGRGAEKAVIEDPRWRVAGLYGRGAERRALIAYVSPSKNPQYLKVGDLLPSGHKIVSIHDSEVCVLIGKRAYRIPVQRTEP